MNIINLTPHGVTIGTVTVPPSGTVARVAVHRTAMPVINLDDGTTIPAYAPAFGDVTDLPDQQDGVILIVSAMVRSHPAVAGRKDVASPGQLVRDANGTIIGCDGLDFNTTAQ
jgi:hypothetical protein